MKEDFLHYLWKSKKIFKLQLFTSQKEPILVHNPGIQIHQSGPDFQNAMISIGSIQWAGQVEMHLKASDWYAHGHETDPSYNNVILHVVWEEDVSVYGPNNLRIPTLELQNQLPVDWVNAYQKLINNTGFLKCHSDLNYVSDFDKNNWLDRLYVERLEQKSAIIYKDLESLNNNWELLLFQKLAYGFGLHKNATIFQQNLSLLPFSVISKLSHDSIGLEAVFFGLNGLLNASNTSNDYEKDLSKEFAYLSHKYGWKNTSKAKPHFFGIRPQNFPTIRLSQLAQLYMKHHSLFNTLVLSPNLNEVYDLLQVDTSEFWKTHFVFDHETKPRKKSLSKKFKELLMINVLIPIRFAFNQRNGQEGEPKFLDWMRRLQPEDNHIISAFKKHQWVALDLLQSQAQIQLHNNYCTQNKCLKCHIGQRILEKE